mmetsp:Transcript_7090/g.14780  ORF Transcript_7090/g.14780 Transcript_7090/m.14780 type:complete len:234 (+) Transcript_7090:875-1576(+)
MLTLEMLSPVSNFWMSTPFADRPWQEMFETCWRTMIPFAVITRISSWSLTVRRQRSLSSSCLNFIAITPIPPRRFATNSDEDILFPYPLAEMTNRSFSSPPRTFISATLSPSRSLIEITPRLVRPVGRNESAAKRLAQPMEVPRRMSSPSRQWWHQLSLSFLATVAIVSPRLVKFSKAINGVFLIQPCSVAMTMYSSSKNSVTGRIEVIVSAPRIGRTEGMGCPFAVRLPVGT